MTTLCPLIIFVDVDDDFTLAPGKPPFEADIDDIDVNLKIYILHLAIFIYEVFEQLLILTKSQIQTTKKEHLPFSLVIYILN